MTNFSRGATATALLVAGVVLWAWPAAAASAASAPAPHELPWWAWSLALFAASFLMGIVAVPAGIGGGTLFVPIVGSLFPFHLDFVRGAGLLVALASALSAGPMLLRSGLGNLRLALPLALLASISSIAGARLGLALPTQLVQALLGALVLGIVTMMWLAPRHQAGVPPPADPLGRWLALHGSYFDRAAAKEVGWQAHRTPVGLLLFVAIGLLGGIFGIGAGWANVPALGLVMGIPLKVAAGTSGLVLSLASSSAAWVYLDRGAVLPAVVVPSVIGVMLGARIGARLLEVLALATVRRLVLVLLLFAGGRALLQGLGFWP